MHEPLTEDERRDLTAEYNNLVAANTAAERRMRAAGVKPTIEDMQRVHLEAIKDLVVGDDPDQVMRFNVATQRHTAAFYERIEAAIPRAMLDPGKVLHLPRQG